MKTHLRAITYFFQRTGLEEQKLYNMLHDDFKTRLDDNSKRSEELMRLYYNQLATDVVSERMSNKTYKRFTYHR
jgi:hypothetical protein